MRILRFILLVLVTLAAIGAAVLLTIDGNLSRIIGRTAFSSGERLFPYTKEEMNEVSWMRINCGGDMAEFRRRPNGVWWGEKPWDDRMDPRAAAAILQYTYSTSIVDALPLHKIDSASLKEFGVKTTPITITLKEMSADGRRSSTMARYTLGSTAPWLVDDPENQTTDDTTYMQTDFYGRDSRILVGTGNILPLFKSGIRQLRDHRPLLIHPAMPASIEINNKGQRIALERPSPDPRTPWKITYPLALDTDPQMMDVLLGTLQKLTAVRVYDPEETSVPDMTDDQVTSVSIRNFTGRLAEDGKSLAVEEKPVTLRIYPPSDNSNLAELVKATVSDRKAVFELAQTTGNNKEVPGVRNIPLDLNLLRSKQLTDIGDYKITGLSIRRSLQDYPTIVRFVQGDEKTGQQPTWMYTAEGSRYQEVNPDHLVSLLKTVKTGNVAGFASDKATDLAVYGLDNPLLTLTMSLLPKPNEEPRPPVIVFFSKGTDGSWYARQSGKPTVVMLDNEYMKNFTANALAWKKKSLLSFNRYNLKEMHLERIGSGGPLVLKFDRLDDSWTASKDGRDETLNINPNRANRYLDELEKTEVVSWLPYTNPEAREALKKPVFRLKLVIQVYKDASQQERQEATGKDGVTFSAEPEMEEKTISMEIAPAGEAGFSRFYYGKINTTPYYFILNMDSVRLLGASLAEDN
ncbi:MAG: DUF4340 domain-containing protein [Akkermansiaceae bacterium]|nr:DUF4340 domain-containing protein [Akkermansiaceae bacterium]